MTWTVIRMFRSYSFRVLDEQNVSRLIIGRVIKLFVIEILRFLKSNGTHESMKIWIKLHLYKTFLDEKNQGHSWN